jgi:hypothetical protein
MHAVELCHNTFEPIHYLCDVAVRIGEGPHMVLTLLVKGVELLVHCCVLLSRGVWILQSAVRALSQKRDKTT